MLWAEPRCVKKCTLNIPRFFMQRYVVPMARLAGSEGFNKAMGFIGGSVAFGFEMAIYTQDANAYDAFKMECGLCSLNVTSVKPKN
jgi:hypothetical protein